MSKKSFDKVAQPGGLDLTDRARIDDLFHGLENVRVSRSVQ
jgi:hypothetical protein